MAANHSFRSALNGFNREDVVHYIEYLNAKHTAQVNQLEAQLEELRKTLEATAQAPVVEPVPEETPAEVEIVETPAQEPVAAPAPQEDLVSRELAAYRRAERAERAAKERADQIYRQAAGTLAQATAQVDDAAVRVQQLVDRVNGQIADLQAAVELSKSALLDAATTMYSIRPEDAE